MTLQLPDAQTVRRIADQKQISLFAARDQALTDCLLSAIDAAESVDDLKEILRILVNQRAVTSY